MIRSESCYLLVEHMANNDRVFPLFLQSDRRAARKMKEHGAKSSPESTVYSRNSEYEYAELNDEMAQPNHPCGDLNEQKNSSDDAQLIFGSTDTDV